MEGDTLLCTGCQRSLDDALIMVCDHNLCLDCARKALFESSGSGSDKPAIRCFQCLQWTPLEPASAAILRDSRAERGAHAPTGRTDFAPYGSRQEYCPPVSQKFTVPQIECKVYPGEPVQFFCLKCEQLLSAEAALHDGHHHDHVDQVLAIKKAYPHVKSAIENMLASYSERLDEIKSHEIAVEGRMRHLAAVADQAKQHTAKVFALVREALGETERELLGRIGDAVKQRADSVDAEATMLRTRKGQLHQNAELISRHMQLEDPVGTLAWYSESKQLLGALGPELALKGQDLQIDHPSVARLGDDIEHVCHQIRSLSGVRFLDDVQPAASARPALPPRGLTEQTPPAQLQYSPALDMNRGRPMEPQGNFYTSPAGPR
jgi:hypothetical protein